MTPCPGEAKVTLMSFGFKYGLPNANYYFDVGFLKNPAREKQWNFFANPSDEMRDFVLAQGQTLEFLDKVVPLLEYLSGIDQHQVFAFGCSAGRHRSSIVVDELSRILNNKGIATHVVHRDL
ncbi:RNase adapter RapZ [Desulfocurvus sp.]|uniref:RapZ C-terminal domain-containing protein n=1 Tax=Desulfocurvus sp. TaxID=2871698 RepID=UPI0025BA944C|nr:RNase adapter RapZ [Desulfocurvus sp.]MCK9238803.1 hypothetical protein [Desulfocurvus sp.]